MTWFDKLTSRKFLSMVVYVLIVILNSVLGWGLEPFDLITMAGAVVGFIVGEAVVDQSYAKADAHRYASYLATQPVHTSEVEAYRALASLFEQASVGNDNGEVPEGPEVTD